MINLKYYILLITLITSLNLFSQDPSFVNFFNNKNYYNPGYVGDNDKGSLITTNRIQWSKVQKNYKTNYINLNLKCPSSIFPGIGIDVLSDIGGHGDLETNIAGLTTSYKYNFGTKYGSFIQFGLKTSLIKKRLNYNNFIFSDQLDVYGEVSETNYSPDQTETKLNPDVSFGSIFRQKIRPKGKIDNLTYTIGGAIHHLYNTYESFNYNNSSIPKKITLHTDIEITTISELTTVGFYILYENQTVLNSSISNNLMTGLNLHRYYFFSGLWTRTNTNLKIKNVKSIIIPFGYNFDNLTIFFTYEIALAYGTFSSYEFSVKYNFDSCFLSSFNSKKRKNKQRRRQVTCPTVKF